MSPGIVTKHNGESCKMKTGPETVTRRYYLTGDELKEAFDIPADETLSKAEIRRADHSVYLETTKTEDAVSAN
jgi:hypothetical protein